MRVSRSLFGMHELADTYLAWIIHEHFFRIRLATFGWALTNMGRLNGPYSRFRHPKRAVGPPKSPIGSQSNSMNVFMNNPG